MDRRALRAFHASLEPLALVDVERDRIEKLDLVDLVAGNLRYAATSAPDPTRAREIAAALEERTAGRLRHAVRLVPDDRPERLRAQHAPVFIEKALARRPVALALAFSWRPRTRPPPQIPPRLGIGPLLGYPPCCVRFEEARRARIVLAEALGMVETWGARTAAEVVRGIDARRPFLVDDSAAGDDARIARLRRFPFVSFVPCEACCSIGDASPSGRENARRREVARLLDPGLVRAIERARGFRPGTS